MARLALVCGVCEKPLPPAKDQGRPRRFCDDICRSQAARMRRRAGEMREYAGNLERLAVRIEAGEPGTRMYGNGKGQREHAAKLREMADELAAKV